MTKLKKSLSILLTLVMLFTVISSGLSAFAATNVSYGQVQIDEAVIVVPETVYMTPSTGASTTGQYYVNNTINTDNGNIVPEANAANTKGYVQLHIPGAKSYTIAVNTITSGIGDIVLTEAGTTSGSFENTAIDCDSNGYYSYNSVGFYINGTGISAGNTALAEWVFTVTMNDGSTRVYYAYSVLYSPYYQPVGAAAKAVGAWHNTYASSILWVSGVHGYATGDSTNLKYVQTANFLPMLGNLKAPNNNNPETNWIQDGSNGLSATISYQSITESGTKYHARANSISPTATITVDTSRYNNFNQIPNFKVGFMVTDKAGITENKGTHAWYVSDYGTSNGSSYYNGTDRGGSQYTGDWNDTGTKIWYSDSDNACGIKVNQQSWNKGISGTSNFRLKSAARSEYKATITSTGWNNNFVNISVTGTNKSDLRQAVVQGTSLNANNYTSASFEAYRTELRNAAAALGNPTANTVALDNLNAKRDALQTTVYLNANGGNVSTSSFNVTIGKNKTVSANVSSYVPTREGYKFVGWATSSNATSGSTSSVTVGFNQTLYAVWQPYVIFDNLIDFRLWNTTNANNGVISDVTDNGFTLTSNDGVSEGTSVSPFFPVTPGKQYKIEMDFVGDGWDVYIFFCDANGTWVDFVDGSSNRYSSNGSTGVDPDNAVFTAPNKDSVVKAQIRVDANGSNNAVTFNNIRVYEVGKVAEGVSYVLSETYAYGSVYGDKLPTPTRYGYSFTGWADENGNKIAADAVVDFTTTKHLYSTWVPGTYKITFDTDGGSAINPIEATYNTAVTAPANPTKTGYTFAGWDKEIPATMPGENITIKAKWNINQYTVTYVLNNGAENIVQSYDYNAGVTAPAAPTKEGYTFAGWENLPSNMPANNVTVNAKWTVNQYTITYDLDNGEANIVDTYDFNADVTAPADPTKSGYTFGGWTPAVPSKMPANNVTVKAMWNINQYTITFDTLGGSAVDSIKGDYNTDVTAPAAPTKEGYTFKGWANLPEKMPANDITVTAIWEANEYTVNYDANGGEGSVEAQTFTYEDTVTLRENAFTKTGYHFIGWALSEDGEAIYAGGQNGVSALTAEAGATITLYAVWEKNTYTVVFDKNDAEATGTMASQSFTYDEVQNLTALGFSKVGYTFTGWNTAADGSGTEYADKAEIINLTSAEFGTVTLYAQWTINLYTVTFKFFDVSGNEITVTREDVAHGTAFNALTLPSSAEGFINTYYNGAVAAPTANTHHYNFTNTWENAVDVITSDITFTAAYAEEAHVYYNDTDNAKPATCEETGIKAEFCDCGYRYQELIPKLGHNYSVTSTTGTCTEDGEITSTCSRCSSTKTEPNYATGHKFSDVTPEQAPTCVSNGMRAYKTCTVCNLYFEETADVMTAGAVDLTGFVLTSGGHSEEILKAVEPGCETTGLTEGKHCTICGIDTVPQTVVPAKGHSYGELIEEVPADCENDGTKAHYECSACHKLFDEEKNEVTAEMLVIEAAGHSYGTLIPEIAATCVKEGTKEHYTCSVCNKNFDSNYNVLDSLVIAKNDNHALATEPGRAPTCELYGWDEYKYCTRECGYTEYEVIPALGHKYVGVETLAPTCTDKGVMTYTCSNDSSHTYTADIAALGHSFGEVVSYDAPECLTDGHVAYKECTTCHLFFAENEGTASLNGKESTDSFVIERTGHSYDAVVTYPTCTVGGYTTHTCSKCGDTYNDTYTDAAGHTNDDVKIENDNPASCTENGSFQEVIYCKVCKVELSRTDKVHEAPGHKEAVRQINVSNATCTVEGSYDNETYCTVCGKSLGIEHVPGAKLPHTYTEKLVDEAHEKSAATCYSPAVYYYDCINCDANAKFDANSDSFTFTDGETVAHTPGTTYVVENSVAATCYSEGSYDNVTYCSVCEAQGIKVETSRDTVTVEKIAHTAGTPKTEHFVDSTCYEEGSYDEVVYCSVCEAAEGIESFEMSRTKKSIAKKAHTPAAAVEEEYVAPSCHTEGSYNEVVYCSVAECHEKLSSTPKTVSKVPHTAGASVQENRNESTCYREGSYDEVVYCSVCKAAEGIEDFEMSRTTKIIAKKDHTPAEAVRENINDSTCYREGTYDAVVYCSVCAAADIKEELGRTEQTIPMKNHTAGEAVTENFVDSTCYSEGSYDEVVYCSVCAAAGIKEELSRTEKTVEKKAHTAGNIVVENEVAPTCYSEGSYDNVTYCSVCEAQDIKVQTSRTTVTVDKVAHTPAQAVKENIVAPKCEVDGSYDLVVYCSVCKEAGKTEVISRDTVTVDRTGHTDGEAEVEDNIPATCTVNGSYKLVVRCTVCNEITSSEVKVNVAPGHKGGETVIENDMPASCTVNGSYEEVVYCTVCGEQVSRETKVYIAPGHKDGEAVVENNVPATCTVDGSYDEVIRCTVCNTVTSSETKINKAPGHTAGTPVKENEVPVTCTVNGSYDEVTYCSVCGEELSSTHVTVEAKGHTPAEAVKENEIPATETVDGSYDSVVYCSVCNVEISRETVVTKVERTITFVMKDKTVKVKAYNGDIVTLPDVEDYKGANGFIYKFVKWDKAVAVVNGDATYTAIYTEPADWTEFDNLEDTLRDVLEGGYADSELLEQNKAEIEDILAKIEAIKSERNTLDKSEQSRVDFVAGKISGIIDIIYPDADSELVITGSSTYYAGSILDIKAVKMPAGTTLTDAVWTSSNENIVFFANGKLYAVGTGTVTLTATRGILKASKTITVIEGGNIRGINFTSINNTHFIVENYMAVYNSAIVYWSNDQELKFTVRVYQSFMFEDYIVYINGKEATPNEEGYYVVPAGSGDVRVTIAGAVIDNGDGSGDTVTKWSFWEWLLQLFRKIADFFSNLFG